MHNQQNPQGPQHQFNAADIETSERVTIFQGFFKLIKYRFRHKLFSGQWSGFYERELLERGHAVAVLAYDPHHDELIFVEQIRIGALQDESPWQFELIAGMIDKGQTAEEAAIRESKEEAGIDLLNLQKIYQFYPSSGGCSEKIDLFIAQVDSKQAQGIHGLEYEHEDILTHRVSREQAMMMLEDGRIENAASIVGLQWLALNHSTLIQKWLGNSNGNNSSK